MIWIMKHPRAHPDMLGFIPSFLDESDPRPARDQFNERYWPGWIPFDGFTMLENGDLSYPSDPPTRLIAETNLRDEIIRFYEHSWVAIIQPNKSFEVCRVD